MKNKLLLLTLLAPLAVLFMYFSFDEENVEQPNAAPVQLAAPTDSVKTFPAIMIKEGDKPSRSLGMDQLKVDIKVIGNIAVTTLDMTFYNEKDRILEGELYFPLGEGQTVSRFAMDVNGKLREGVVVEKEQGRVAFESTVRKQIDPGLLELTKGNNFKSRVYPIPAKGYKRIVIAYEQELEEKSEHLIYYLPMHFPDKLKKLDIKAEVFNQKLAPQVQPKSLSNITFNRWEENFVATYHNENVWAKSPIYFAIPKTDHKENIIIEKGADGDYYFYVLTGLELSQGKALTKPKNITILWDASSSRGEQGLSKLELEIIEQYIQEVKPQQTELVIFSNDVREKIIYNTKTGDASALINKIKATPFDGATQYGVINTEALKGEHVLLFSDGLSNFGKKELSPVKQPLFTINTSSKADHSRLRYMAEQTPGHYINLSLRQVAWPELRKHFLYQQQKFVQVSAGNVTEVYPKRIKDFNGIQKGFVGKLKGTETRLKLSFGFDKEMEQATTITMDLDVDKHLTTTGLVEKLWAQKKLAELDLRYEKNKDKITALGKEYGIVTRNTSLLVLDRVEDYVAHKITPPSELLEEYNKLISDQTRGLEKSESEHLARVYADFQERVKWWEKEFKVLEIKTKKDKLIADTVAYRLRGNVSDVATYMNAEPTEEAIQERRESEVVTEIISSEQMQATGSVSYGWSATDDDAMEEDEKAVEAKGGRKSAIALEAWNPDTPYIKELAKVRPAELYKTYLQLKETYKNQPSFYLDVADLFIANDMKEEALRVLSNIAELELENHALLRILAHRLEQLKYYDLAISVYLDVKDIRAEEPQTFRDLGLCYALNGEPQKAVDMLYHVVSNSWDMRFPGIEALAACEMNKVIANASQELDLSGIDEKFIKSMPVDMRVVLNWDTDNCDMDLWVTDPRGEKCFYSHKLTVSGGRMSNDFTRGYGPEEFVIKKALPGEYKVEVNYYGTSSQKLSGPTTIQVKMITNYGREKEQAQEVTRRLGTAKEVLSIGSFSFKHE